MRHFLTGAVLVAALATSAGANGRFPQSVDVIVAAGDPDRRLVALTFGLLSTSDGGGEYRWICEEALGYSGTFDPPYALLSDGTIILGAFDGLRTSTDGGCTFTVHPQLAGLLAGAVEVGADGRLWVGASAAADDGLWVSGDGGQTFARSGLPSGDMWWESVAIAPSDPDRVYVTGFAVGTEDLDAGAAVRARLFVSADGGGSFAPLDLDDVVFGTEPRVQVVGVWPSNPALLFLRVVEATGVGDALYRSADGGASFTRVLEVDTPIEAFHITLDGRVIAGGKFGVRISVDGGLGFGAGQSTPLLGCLTQLGDGTLLGCGANWEPDFMAVGTSADALTWTSQARFTDIAGPLACPPGTVQHDTCVDVYYDVVCPFAEAQGCFGGADAGPRPPDARPGPDGPVILPPPSDHGGCGGCGAAALWLGLALSRRRARGSAAGPR